MKSVTTILNLIKNIFLKRIVDIFSLFFVISIIILEKEHNPMIAFLDVGQGDSILIQQDQFQILIDGGGDSTVLFEISKYIPVTDNRIEILVLTHPHADHLFGLLDVLERYEIGEVWVNTIQYELKEYEYFNSLELNFREISFGDSLEYKDVDIKVLYPFEKDRGLGCKGNINNESVVLEVRIKNNSIYLMGDAEQEVEKELIERNIIHKADILKAGHHCSKTATSKIFLNQIKPDMAICSCGENNKFGHPHDETVEKFVSSNVQYMVTSEEGNIVFRFK